MRNMSISYTNWTSSTARQKKCQQRAKKLSRESNIHNFSLKYHSYMIPTFERAALRDAMRHRDTHRWTLQESATTNNERRSKSFIIYAWSYTTTKARSRISYIYFSYIYWFRRETRGDRLTKGVFVFISYVHRRSIRIFGFSWVASGISRRRRWKKKEFFILFLLRTSQSCFVTRKEKFLDEKFSLFAC